MMASSGVEAEIRALGARFVAIFRFAGEAKGRTGRVKENQRTSQTCWGDFRFNLCLPGPRGGHRWTRLVPQFDFLKLSSKSGLWEAISWPIFVFEKCRIPITKTFFAKTPKDLLIGCWGQ